MKLSNYFFLLAMLCTTFFSCEDVDPFSDDPEQQEEQQGNNNVNWQEILDAAGVTPPVQNKDEVSTSTEESEGAVHNLETHDVVQGAQQITYLGLNDDILWPGNLIKGNSIASFNYSPIVLPRGPINLSVNLEGSTGNGALSTRIENPTLSSVRQGIHDIIGSTVEVGVNIPAKVELQKTRVYSESHLDIAVGADVSYGAVDVAANFNFNSSSTKTRIVAKYKQIYYTINVDTPVSTGDWFGPDVTTEQAVEAMPAGSQPVYVSGVSYGAMAMMFIESDYDEETINAALDASYNSLSTEVNITSELTAKEVMENSRINIVVYGGSTSGVAQFNQLNLDEFFQYISASSQFNTESDAGAVPMVYSFRHLKNHTLAQVALTSQYTIDTVVPTGSLYRVYVREFYFDSTDDEGTDNDVDIDRLTVEVKALERTAPGAAQEELTSLVPYPSGWPTTNILFQPITNLYYYTTEGNGYEVGGGESIWPSEGNRWIPQYRFDLQDHDFDQAVMTFNIMARDYDSVGDDEWAVGSFELSSTSFLSNGGLHNYTVECDDFKMTARIQVEAI